MRKILALIFLNCFFISCGGGKDTPAPEPEAATLSSPSNNEACTTGTVLSDTDSKISFNWVAGANANSYLLTVTNLLTQVQQSQATTTTSAELTLKRNTPYSWFVTSKSSKNPTTVNSSTWKFYNAGLASSSYPPYPAEIVSPTLGQVVTPTAGKITLQWRGSDADNDITNYDIYLGTTTTPILIKSQHTTTSLTDVAVNPNTNYYWKVITRDAKGNTSESGLLEFKTN
jgi:hypothetical protein